MDMKTNEKNELKVYYSMFLDHLSHWKPNKRGRLNGFEFPVKKKA